MPVWRTVARKEENMAVWTITVGTAGAEVERLEAEMEALLRTSVGPKRVPTLEFFSKIRMLELEYIRVHRQALGYPPKFLPTRQRVKFLVYRQAKKRGDTTRVAI